MRAMRLAISVVLSAWLASSPADAQQRFANMLAPVPAPAEAGAIPLYGDQTPGSADTEIWTVQGPIGFNIRNVTYPTLTPVLPRRGKATGAAVIVAPGGAFIGLAIEHEGWKVARALADRGIAAFVLKYRLVQTPADGMAAMRFIGEKMMKEIAHPMEGDLLKETKAPEDAKAAIALVRSQAARWGVDASRVGIIGFSAGAMTSRRVALDRDPAARPAFVGYVYGPQEAEPVPADAPPLFDAIALDDPLFPNKGFAIAEAWRLARRPVEIHAYQSGGHGFGLGRPGHTESLLLDQFTAWLSMQGFLNRKTAQ